jgi:hypothetical protein
VISIRDSYERLLDLTADYVLKEQQELRELYLVPPEQMTDFAVGSYVLWSVLVKPSNKLMYRWRGPYEVMAREINTVTLRDLTNDSLHTTDISRLKQFLVLDDSFHPVEIAAANLFGEVEVDCILSHCGSPSRRKEMTFLVRWMDGSESEEPWETVKKLAALDAYIKQHPALKRLAPKG